jgi:fructosamine-3-kinase
LARRVEALAADLHNRLPARPAPALLHGDLWGGNILAAGDRVSGLIDPACYYGHAEVDLAMLGLFDQPGAAFTEAYGAPEPGHDERSAIYRLWPALVHLRLFGPGYRPMVDRLLDAIGARAAGWSREPRPS